MILRLLQIVQICSILSIIVDSNSPFTRANYRKEPGYPVVLVPGDGGSQLEANLTGKPSVVHYVCSKYTSDYFDLWLNLELFAPLVIDCWVDNMMLVYNVTNGNSTNMPGVDIRVPGFGGTSSIEWLDKSKVSTGLYFNTLVEMMVSWGYRRGKDVVGAPYDWRKAPNELHSYYTLLKIAIETLFRYNSNKKVIIIGHSMGNPVMLYFLNNYVDEINDVQKFFHDINYDLGWEQYKNAAQLNGDLAAPGVETHCLYGSGIATPEQFKWSKGYFPDFPPSVITGDGDGTVNRRSAEVCLRWNKDNNNGKRVTTHEIVGVEHMAIMQNPTAIEIVRKAIYDLL